MVVVVVILVGFLLLLVLLCLSFYDFSLLSLRFIFAVVNYLVASALGETKAVAAVERLSIVAGAKYGPDERL